MRREFNVQFLSVRSGYRSPKTWRHILVRVGPVGLLGRMAGQSVSRRKLEYQRGTYQRIRQLAPQNPILASLPMSSPCFVSSFGVVHRSRVQIVPKLSSRSLGEIFAEIFSLSQLSSRHFISSDRRQWGGDIQESRVFRRRGRRLALASIISGGLPREFC